MRDMALGSKYSTEVNNNALLGLTPILGEKPAGLAGTAAGKFTFGELARTRVRNAQDRPREC